MKFKIGDKVVIINNDQGHNKYDTYIGNKGIINDISVNGLIYIKNIPYCWKESELEFVKNESLKEKYLLNPEKEYIYEYKNSLYFLHGDKLYDKCFGFKLVYDFDDNLNYGYYNSINNIYIPTHSLNMSLKNCDLKCVWERKNHIEL